MNYNLLVMPAVFDHHADTLLMWYTLVGSYVPAEIASYFRRIPVGGYFSQFLQRINANIFHRHVVTPIETVVFSANHVKRNDCV